VSPKYFYQVEFRSIRYSILNNQSFLLPPSNIFFKFFAPMYRGIIQNTNCFFLDFFTKIIQTGNNNRGMNRLVKEIWIQFILSIHQTHNVYAAPFCRRNFYDASCFLPGIWNIRVEGKS
jgi:hypothetical protein